ncbi:MAG: D-aminoacyl-tRNA deacylase [Haloarculaceae archaeon]
MLAVVVSRADAASTHIRDHLLEVTEWTEHTDSTRPDGEGGGTVYRTTAADDTNRPTRDDRPVVELREFDPLHLEIAGAADAFGAVDDGPTRVVELLVFASRHSGETGRLLTAHHTGNVGDAEFGGEDRSLARACPNAHGRVLDALAEHAPDEYEVGTECTHHGPSSVGAPSMFVEVGSGRPQWDDPDAARAVAQAILDLRGVAPDAPREDGSRRHLVGLGGGHYAPRFERIARETDWAVGHVAADWALEAMGDPADSEDVLEAAFAESAARRAVVDGDHPDVVAAVADLGYEVVSETWVRETTGVPLPLVEALEAAVATVGDGLRFGEPARSDGPARDGSDETASPADRDADRPPDFEVVTLPAELLAEARGIDREATRDAVEGATLAFETDQSGTRVRGRAAVTGEDSFDALVDDLAAILAASYDRVERTDGAVVAREEAFDPERARELGVPEGPKFGRLSAGSAVEVDGETVAPEDVHVERERRFPIPAGGE